jgi:hypothetical protein
MVQDAIYREELGRQPDRITIKSILQKLGKFLIEKKISHYP